jgi:hypothetical protein
VFGIIYCNDYLNLHIYKYEMMKYRSVEAMKKPEPYNKPEKIWEKT